MTQDERIGCHSLIRYCNVSKPEKPYLNMLRPCIFNVQSGFLFYNNCKLATYLIPVMFSPPHIATFNIQKWILLGHLTYVSV